MAIKKAPAKPATWREQIEALLRAGNFAEAWKLARNNWTKEPNAESLAFCRTVVTRACEHFAEANRPTDFAKYFELGEWLPKGEGNEWTIALGLFQARAGYFNKAKTLFEPLNDPALLAKAVAYVADKTVVGRHAGLLPAEYHAGYEAIIAGFGHFHSGNDEAARESLGGIGLQSPYLEWKLLLRGLIAYSANDDGRAIENFARLDPERIPSKIAVIFRAQIDPSFRDRLPPEAAAQAERKSRSLYPAGLHTHLKSIQSNLGRGRSLTAAFSALESALPFLKAQKPELLPRLANCFYHAILHQGQPDDMKRYRKSFGPPKEDPQFLKLQGTILEQTDQLDASLACWKGYALWLEAPPEGWPGDLTKRVHARVLYRMGNIAVDLADWKDEPEEDFLDFFGQRKKAKPKAPKPVIDPLVFFSSATEAAPDWEEPALEVFDRYSAEGRIELAEAAANTHLKSNPGSLAMLEKLGTLYGIQGRAEECLQYRRKALAANPLDKTVVESTLRATIAVARRLAAGKNYVEAEETLKQATELNGGHPHYAESALRAGIAQKLGQAEDAQRHAAAMGDLPQSEFLRRYLRQIHATLLKFKPAEKKVAVAEFAEALKQKPAPISWCALLMAMSDIDAEGWGFTGEAALRKKILAAIAGSAQPGFELDTEGMAAFLQEKKEWPTLQKFAANASKHYPRNPLFPYLEVVTILAQPAKKFSKGTLSNKLYKAEDLIRLMPESKHAYLLPDIQKMQSALNPLRSMFDSFFGPR